MKDMLKYKGYYGSIHFDEDDLILFGKVEFVKAVYYRTNWLVF